MMCWCAYMAFEWVTLVANFPLVAILFCILPYLPIWSARAVYQRMTTIGLVLTIDYFSYFVIQVPQ